jgi:hypothetical protein
MTEWHIFTKDGNEYTGASLTYEQGCMVLYRRHYWKVSQDRRDWKWLWLKFKTVEWKEQDRTYDFIIPIPEVLRVERWDISEKESARKMESASAK